MLGDLGKLIVAKGFKKLPKVQKIARSGHTDGRIVVATYYLTRELGIIVEGTGPGDQGPSNTDHLGVVRSVKLLLLVDHWSIMLSLTSNEAPLND